MPRIRLQLRRPLPRRLFLIRALLPGLSSSSFPSPVFFVVQRTNRRASLAVSGHIPVLPAPPTSHSFLACFASLASAFLSSFAFLSAFPLACLALAVVSLALLTVRGQMSCPPTCTALALLILRTVSNRSHSTLVICTPLRGVDNAAAALVVAMCTISCLPTMRGISPHSVSESPQDLSVRSSLCFECRTAAHSFSRHVAPSRMSPASSERHQQGVAVDWIFSSRTKLVGFRAHFGRHIGGGWRGAVLDIFEVNGRVSRRARCLHENTFLSQNYQKNCKKCSATSNNTISNSMGRQKKQIFLFLEKCFKPFILTQFCGTELDIFERRIPLN